MAALTNARTRAQNPPSPARLAANRRNAELSTGPKTEEGKARRRLNAVKHGLTGAGLALPSEVREEVEGRFAALHEELAPQTVLGGMLTYTVALSFTRMQRAARQEAASLSFTQRHATEDFDDARMTDAEENVRRIGLETATHHRRLLLSPEGIDLLILRLGDVRREVRNPNIRWSYIHGSCLENFCGRESHDPFTRSRGRALSLALEFNPSELTDADKAEIGSEDVKQVREWAKPRMEAFIDAEIARLQAHRAMLDHDGIARDRAEAVERALFDPSREASLARRYGAAAQRQFYRALQELRHIESGRVAPDNLPAQTATETPSKAAAEVFEEGDAAPERDPADEPIRPKVRPDFTIRPELASSGITVSQASREISYPHYSLTPVPFDQPPPVYDEATRTWK